MASARSQGHNDAQSKHLNSSQAALGTPAVGQQRIAAILDQAEALRAKRRHALANSTPSPNPSSSTSLAIPRRIIGVGPRWL